MGIEKDVMGLAEKVDDLDSKIDDVKYTVSQNTDSIGNLNDQVDVLEKNTQIKVSEITKQLNISIPDSHDIDSDNILYYVVKYLKKEIEDLKESITNENI